MITVNDYEKEFILDLNKTPYDEHILSVKSEQLGELLPWGVEMVSNDLINVEPINSGVIKVNVNVEELKNDAFFLLRNYNKERVKVAIIHNALISAPKTYKFKITKKSTDGRKIRVKILSKENEDDIGWECTYDGKPLNYLVTPKHCNKGCYVDIELMDELFKSIPTTIEFTQVKSKKTIRLELEQHNDNTMIIKVD